MNPKRIVALVAIPLLLITFLWNGARAADKGPRFARLQLANGLVVLLAEEHTLPFVTMRLLVDAGSKNDPPREEGLARLTARGLLFGTRELTVSRINRDLDLLAASLSATAGKDYASINLRFLKKDLDRAFGLFFETLTLSVFPEDEIRREVERTLSGIKLKEEDPGQMAADTFDSALFLKTPYGHPEEGTRESLPGLDRAKVLKFYHDYYGPNNAIMAITGDITSAEVKSKIIPLLEKWPHAKALEKLSAGPYRKGPVTVTVDKPVTQASIIIGNRGLSRDNPDYLAVTVMNHILGGGSSSRLTASIRNSKGLAYAVSSEFEAGKLPGAFEVALQTKNASAREAIDLVLKEMERMRREPVSGVELEKAKRYLTGSFPMRFDSQAKLAQFLLAVEFYGLGMDYAVWYPALIDGVSREDVLRVARTYLDPEKPVIVVVANLKEAGIGPSARDEERR